MDFDLTTFALEIVNFLVLVWLLKRFLYQPVLAVIEKRQNATAQIIMNAKNIQQEAQTLKSEYETHLVELDKEYAITKARIDEEISTERVRGLASLDTDMATERKRRESLEDRKRRELEQTLERQAIQLASRFASRLLERLANPELNAKLTELAIDDIEKISDEQQEQLRAALDTAESSIKVVSAFTLNELQRRLLADALSQLAGREIVPEFSEDSSLKAGVSIMIGSWVVMANLRDELSFFSGTIEHES